MTDFGSERMDWVYLVVTVKKTKNTYRLRLTKPILAVNEFAYSFKVTIDKKEWLQRITELELEKVSPPEVPKPENLIAIIPKTIATQALDRLAGREGAPETYQGLVYSYKGRLRMKDDVAARVLNRLAGRKKTVQFEDHGQDFLEWVIEGGIVVACRPCQGWLWNGTEVHSINIQPGLFLDITTTSGTRTHLRYPVERVKEE